MKTLIPSLVAIALLLTGCGKQAGNELQDGAVNGSAIDDADHRAGFKGKASASASASTASGEPTLVPTEPSRRSSTIIRILDYVFATDATVTRVEFVGLSVDGWSGRTGKSRAVYEKDPITGKFSLTSGTAPVFVPLPVSGYQAFALFTGACAGSQNTASRSLLVGMGANSATGYANAGLLARTSSTITQCLLGAGCKTVTLPPILQNSFPRCDLLWNPAPQQ